MSTYVVTGGCGFIGSYVIKELLKITYDPIKYIDDVYTYQTEEELYDLIKLGS